MSKTSKLKSVRALTNVKVDETSELGGTTRDTNDLASTSFDLETFLPTACARMEVLEDIIMIKEYQRGKNITMYA